MRHFLPLIHGLCAFFRPLLTPVSAAPSLPVSQFTVCTSRFTRLWLSRRAIALRFSCIASLSRYNPQKRPNRTLLPCSKGGVSQVKLSSEKYRCYTPASQLQSHHSRFSATLSHTKNRRAPSTKIGEPEFFMVGCFSLLPRFPGKVAPHKAFLGWDPNWGIFRMFLYLYVLLSLLTTYDTSLGGGQTCNN